ncbi:MAG: hypothetical protein V2B19_12085 [Pseudomonadota bacterium]
MQKLDGRSADILADNTAKLKALFPEAFTEGKIDFNVLKSSLWPWALLNDVNNWHRPLKAPWFSVTAVFRMTWPRPI